MVMSVLANLALLCQRSLQQLSNSIDIQEQRCFVSLDKLWPMACETVLAWYQSDWVII